MKKILSSLVFFLCLGVICISAQGVSEKKEAIILELKIKVNEEIVVQKLDFPLDTNIKEVGGGGFAYGIECDHCDESKLPSYIGGYMVKSLGQKVSKLKFWVKIKNTAKKCSVKTKFKVFRNRRTNLNLNCGVTLVAYYGFELEEEN